MRKKTLFIGKIPR